MDPDDSREPLLGFGIVGNSLWMVAGNVVQLVAQLLAFVILARRLEPAGFGAFAGALALGTVFGAFSTWGTGDMLVMDVARGENELDRALGQALLTTTLFGALLAAVLTFVGHLILGSGVPLALLVPVAFAEVLFGRLVVVSGRVFQAVGQLRVTARLFATNSVLRLAGAGLLLVVPGPLVLVYWGGIYLATSVLSATIALGTTFLRFGWPARPPSPVPQRPRLGAYFSFAEAARSIYGDIDKAMLVRLASSPIAGAYDVAYRAVTVATLPVFSVLSSAYAQFFRTGVSGGARLRRMVGRLLGPLGLYGLGVGAALWFLSPLVLMIVGRSYSASVTMLRWLSVMPLLSACHFTVADALTGAGKQGLRTTSESVSALANLALNAVLIPLFSWRGAVVATIGSEVLLLLSLAFFLLRINYSGPSGSRPPFV